MLDVTYLDIERLKKRFGGRGIVRDICLLYLEESPAVIEEYRNVGKPPVDFREMGAAAHRLKGSLGMLGAETLTEIASELEQACLAPKPKEALSLYKQLDAGLGGLRREVERLAESI